MFFSVFTKGPPYGKNPKNLGFHGKPYKVIFFSYPPPIIFFVSNIQVLIGPKLMIIVHKICPSIFLTPNDNEMALPGCILK